MRLHRYVLRPLSPWGTPLRSDTLYGLVLLRVAEQDGDAACRALAAAFREGEPPFALSSAVPQGKVFAPRLPPLPRALFRRLAEEGAFRKAQALNLFEALQKYKRFRKLEHLPLDVWLRHAGSLSGSSLFKEYVKDEFGTEVPERFAASETEPHVTIHRMTGGAVEGGLFFNRLTWFAAEARFHLYARTDKPEELLDLLRLVGDLGFGKDASTGKGRFAVVRDEAFDPAPLERAGPDRLLLSVCAAPDMAGTAGCYAVEVKRGKAAPGLSPFKNPLLLLREGGVLRTLPAGPYVLEHIHPDPNIVQVTHPLTLPCRMAEEAA